MQTKHKWLAAATMVLWAMTGGAAELNVATVDLDKVFTAHPKTQAAEAELKQAEGVIQQDLEKMVAEGRVLEEEVAKLREAAKSPVLTDEARRKKATKRRRNSRSCRNSSCACVARRKPS